MIYELLTTEPDAASVTDAALLWDVYRRALAGSRHVVAYGPPGTGKTHAALTHGLNGRRVMRYQCNPGDLAENVLGRIGIVNGSTVFQPGAGTIAVETGARLVFDEVDRASDDVIALLYALADGKPFVLSDGTTVTPAAGLQVILTTNADPWELFPADSGIRDRFPFVSIPEPCAEALATLPAPMRDSARRAVRHGITGLRAWQHFAELLADHGYGPTDILGGLDCAGRIATNANGLALPSLATRERIVETLAGVTFGSDGPEVVRAWRVGACRDLAAPVPVIETDLDRAVRQAFDRGYASGHSDGYDEAAEINAHAHDVSDCAECEAIRDSAEEAAMEAAMEYHECEHEHDTDDCSACAALYAEGEESVSQDFDSALDVVWNALPTDYGRIDDAVRSLANAARADGFTAEAEDIEALVDLIAEVTE